MPRRTTPSIKAVVFDCFGVLYVDAFKEFIEHYLPSPDDPERRRYYELALASDRGHVPVAQFYAELSTLSGEDPVVIQQRLHAVSAISRGVVSIINELRPHYKIGMLSNAERSFLDRFLANHNLGAHFDTILASSETRYVKPERGIFDELARRLGLPFEQIIFIDDSEANAVAAAGYGMSAIHYRTPAHLHRDLATILGL